MRRKFIILITIVLSFCTYAQEPVVIYKSDNYVWMSDKIVQGKFEGKALSNTEIKSNYSTSLIQKDTLRYTWNLTNDISRYPQYNAPTILESAVYNMGLDEMVKAVEPNLTLRTGEWWGGVWTRDMSYSIILSMAYMQPTIAKNCLLLKINQLGKIIQDTGTGGSWPVSTDRMVWVSAAWEIYKITADLDWLRCVYPVIERSLKDDFVNVYDVETGLVMGESSFIDWREQSYPKWMKPIDIYKSKCLGTNALHYRALWILGRMGEILGKEEAGMYKKKAEDLKEAINKYLWMPDKGYYGQFLYGRNGNVLSPRSETLGESLCVLFDIASPEQQQSIIEHMPVLSYGPTIFYPQICDVPSYHNNALWPFVTSFWTMASSKVQNENAVIHGIGSIYRAAALFATNKENFDAQNGDWGATELNSSIMLWSLSGNLALVHRVLFGINFNEDKIVFRPIVPKAMSGSRKLTGFLYRNDVLDIEMEGYGSNIASFILDGKEIPEPIFEGNLWGKHTIKMILDNNDNDKTINEVDNKFTLPTPVAVIDNDVLIWPPVRDAVSYKILCNGKEIAEQKKTIFTLKAGNEGEYQIIAVSKDKECSSFASEPLLWNKNIRLYNLNGIRMTRAQNRKVTVPIEVEREGVYILDWSYSNGNGSIPNKNKCAVRSLLVDDKLLGASVFPQLGQDNWEVQGWSNSIKIFLTPGKHDVVLEFRQENENMNIDINEAVLYALRLMRMKDD